MSINDILRHVEWVIKNPPGWNSKTERWWRVAVTFDVGFSTACDLCRWAGHDPRQKKPTERKRKWRRNE